MIKIFEEFIMEYSDYRNVTGYGTMGIGGEQNVGPSFNKGPDAATYRRPDVIGVTSDVISDPYFNGKYQKLRRAKKDPKTKKNRIKKSRYFDRIDTDSQNKILESKNNPKPHDKEALELIEKMKEDFDANNLRFVWDYITDNDWKTWIYDNGYFKIKLGKFYLDKFKIGLALWVGDPGKPDKNGVNLKVSGYIKRDLWKYFEDKLKQNEIDKIKNKINAKENREKIWQTVKDVDPYKEEAWEE